MMLKQHGTMSNCRGEFLFKRMTSATPSELKGRLNRLSVYSKLLVDTMVMDPVQNLFERKHSEEELNSIEGIIEELRNSDLFWKVINRQIMVSPRTFQLFRIASILYYIHLASDPDIRVESLQRIQLLLEKKLPIEDEMIKEFLILCVDLRTNVFTIHSRF